MSPSLQKLKGIQSKLGESLQSKVVCIKPEGFVDWLTTQAHKPPKENVVRGYRVKVKYDN